MRKAPRFCSPLLRDSHVSTDPFQKKKAAKMNVQQHPSPGADQLRRCETARFQKKKLTTEALKSNHPLQRVLLEADKMGRYKKKLLPKLAHDSIQQPDRAVTERCKVKGRYGFAKLKVTAVIQETAIREQ